MSDKHTQCPDCETTYKVSVIQLTVAQGMVCCPKCLNSFNALTYLVHSTHIPQTIAAASYYQDLSQNLSVKKSTLPSLENPIDTIFSWKPKNSNIDLRIYLNNLAQFNHHPISNTPLLNLSSNTHEYSQHKSRKKTLLYYLIWPASNIICLSILLFQILWFNPNLNERYPLLNALFSKTCAILHCDTTNQHYYQIKIEDLTVQHNTHDSILFSGVLINHYKKSLELPKIQVKFRKNRIETATYVILPHQYLNPSLSGIRRIPKESPYPFKFTIPNFHQPYDHYHLEIIHP